MTKPTYDRRAIMKDAWRRYRASRAPHLAYSAWWFRRALLEAWHAAKMAMRRSTQTAADRIREALWLLDCKDHLTPQGYREIARLQTELRQTPTWA